MRVCRNPCGFDTLVPLSAFTPLGATVRLGFVPKSAPLRAIGFTSAWPGNATAFTGRSMVPIFNAIADCFPACGIMPGSVSRAALMSNQTTYVYVFNVSLALQRDIGRDRDWPEMPRMQGGRAETTLVGLWGPRTRQSRRAGIPANPSGRRRAAAVAARPMSRCSVR